MKASFGAAQCKYLRCDVRPMQGAGEEIPIYSPKAQCAETLLALSETTGREPLSVGLLSLTRKTRPKIFIRCAKPLDCADPCGVV